MLNEIYEATNKFDYLKTYHKRKKGSNLVFGLVVLTMLSLMLAAFSGFQPFFFIIFVIISLVTIAMIIIGLVVDNYYFQKSKMYEDVVIDILHKWNKKYRDKGIKFSIMRSFYVLMIHADYKKPGFKYNLVFGKRIFDSKGKLVKTSKTPALRPGPNYINRQGQAINANGQAQPPQPAAPG
jgi:hypothetical protein